MFKPQNTRRPLFKISSPARHTKNYHYLAVCGGLPGGLPARPCRRFTVKNGDATLEERIKNDLAVTVRCIPLDGQKLCDDQGRPGTCPFTGEPSAKRVVWAKSY